VSEGAAPAPPHVVVVGGGITGLSAAHRLLEGGAREGRVRVTLLEASRRLGGKVATARADGMTVEEGPDSFLVRKPWARDLCRALDLESELVATPPAKRRSFIYHRGRLYPVPPGLASGAPSRLLPFLLTPLVSPAGKARAMYDLLAPRVLPPDGRDVSLGAFLRARLGPEVVARLVEPLLTGIYAGDADALSLDATFPHLRHQESEHRSLILAARAAAARSPRPTSPPPPAFLTLRGGLDTLVDALEAALREGGVDVRLGAPVRTVERAGRGGYAVRLEGEEVRADAVIVAAPAPAAASVLAQLAPDAGRELAAIAYADVALVALAYDRAEVPHRLDGSGFVVPRGEDLGVTACTWVSEKWPHSAPPGRVLLRAYLGRAGEDVLSRPDADLVAAARRAAARALGVRAAPRWTHVVRTPAALPQYAVGHLARLERIDAALRGLEGLFVAGAALRGVGLPDCVRQGQEAAEAALALLIPSRRAT
jgi:oxygen-dependent protoporphyrinogen oxidase